MTRTHALQEISNLLDSRCAVCPTRAQYIATYGKRFAKVDAHCIHICPVGKQLQELGQHLQVGARKFVEEEPA